MNRSVIVEPSQLIVSSRGPVGGKKATLQKIQVTTSDQKINPNHNGGVGGGGIQEFEMMKNELKSKDMLILNLRDRLQNLEDKVNGI